MRSNRTLSILLWVVVAAVLVQAVLAGGFISGAAANWRLAHTIVAAFLPFYAIVVAVVAASRRRAGTLSGGVAVACYLLPVVLFVQEVLGHMPFPVSTAVHVPLGVTIFGGSIVLAQLADRPVARPSPAPPPRVSAHTAAVPQADRLQP